MNAHGRIGRALAVWSIALLAGCATPPSPPTPAAANIRGTPAAPTGTATATAQPPTITPSWTPFPTKTPTPNPLFMALWQHQANQVLYWTNNHLCLLGDSDTPIYLADATDSSFARISPDGKLVVVVRTHNSYWEPGIGLGLTPFDISVVDADGSHERLLLTSDQLGLSLPPDAAHYDYSSVPIAITQMEWIPGTHRLVFSTEYAAQVDYSVALHSLDADTASHHVILDRGHGGNFTIAPDGRHVALVTPTSIGLMNSNGTDWQPDVLDYPGLMTYSDSPGFVQPVWNLDSTGLRVAIPPQDPQGTDTTVRNWFIPADGKPPYRTTTIDGLRIADFGSVVMSPDGLYLVAMTSSQDRSSAALHLMSPDGLDDHVVYSGYVVFEGWEADSRHFLFRTTSQPPDRYRGSVDGGYYYVSPPTAPAGDCQPR